MRRNLFLLISVVYLVGAGNYLFSQQSHVDSLIRTIEQSNVDTIQAEAVKKILIYYVRNKEYDNAEEYAFKFFELSKGIGTNKMLGKAYYNLGIVKWLKKEQDLSNQYFEESIPYLVATPDSMLLAKMLYKNGD